MFHEKSEACFMTSEGRSERSATEIGMRLEYVISMRLSNVFKDGAVRKVLVGDTGEEVRLYNYGG